MSRLRAWLRHRRRHDSRHVRGHELHGVCVDPLAHGLDPDAPPVPTQVLIYTTLQWFQRETLEDFRQDTLAELERRFGRRAQYLARVSYRGVESWLDPQPEWTRTLPL